MGLRGTSGWPHNPVSGGAFRPLLSARMEGADMKREPPRNGRCCSCGYSGAAESACTGRDDDVHCEHWQDGPDEPADIDSAPSVQPVDYGGVLRCPVCKCGVASGCDCLCCSTNKERTWTRKRPLVHLSLSPEAIARLAEIATRCGETRSGVVEKLIREAEMPRPRTAGATRT